MKKIISSLILSASAAAASAGITVPVVWAFSPASNQANALRQMIDNANKEQSQYEFVFDNKPGAGGSIGVNSVINSDRPSLILISTSVLVRPKFYPNQSYDLDKLRPVAITAVDSPLVVLSKYRTLKEMLAAPGYSIGMVSGSITEAVAIRLQEMSTKGRSITFVPYAGTIDATRDAVGGHIDASVEFIKDAIPWEKSGQLHIVLNTAKQKGFEDLVGHYYLLTSSGTHDSLVEDWNKIFVKAANQPNVIDTWQQDYAKTTKWSVRESEDFWAKQRKAWE